MAAHPIPLRFHVSPGGCWTCISHAPNADGYIRKRWSWGLEFLHRVVWRLRHGDTPDGHEIDHVCGNRACCAPEHLRTLPCSEHKAITNTARYSQRQLDARRAWEAGDPINAPARTAARWVKNWTT